MPATELCLIHPGGLSASCWARMASHLPAGTPVKVLELEAVNRFWADDPELTVAALADRLRGRLGTPGLLVGWGAGGAVADALAPPPARVVVLDGLAPGALNEAPDTAARLRSFAMFLGARRGRALDGAPRDLDDVLEAAVSAGALRAETSRASLERWYAEHERRVLRDHRLTQTHAPSGAPLTVVKAARSLAPEAPALGWDRFGPVERLGSGGDHYSMLTDGAAVAHLALLLRRWLAPACSTAA
ncbi:MAG TPA: hypothetical protein VNS09_11710 [Solirubrobacter sp.]|nr:hypothetical protein [Solirubrobacter sp.]